MTVTDQIAALRYAIGEIFDERVVPVKRAIDDNPRALLWVVNELNDAGYEIRKVD